MTQELSSRRGDANFVRPPPAPEFAAALRQSIEQCGEGRIARTGSPWRDLPCAFGNWMSVYTRFRDWAKAGVWKRLFDAVSDEPDMEYVMVDATIVKVHRHGQGAKGGRKTRPSAAPKAV